MGKNRPTQQPSIKCRLTRLAYPINALMLMTFVIRNFQPTTAIRAPPSALHTTRDARDNYQSHNEDATALSTGYALSQNYYETVPRFAATTNEENTSTYGSTAGSSKSERYENMQQFPSTRFTPTTISAAGQHFVDTEQGDDFSKLLAKTTRRSVAQIGGIRAMGRYRAMMPPGKIDYEINAANYDAGTEIASGSNEPSADIMQSNDAYNVAALHDSALSQQKVNGQQHHKPQRQPHYLQQSQPQLDFDMVNAPDVQSLLEDFESYGNENEGNPTPKQAKYQQLNAAEQNQQLKQQSQRQYPRQQQTYLHNFESLQNGNYWKKPSMSDDMFQRDIIGKAKQVGHTHSLMLLQPRQLSHGFRIIHSLKQQPQQSLQSKLNQQRHSRDDDFYIEDAVNAPSQHYYTHTPVDNNNLSPGYERGPHSISTFQSHLPPISQTVHHTPASAAAAAGIPLNRHIEVIKHVHIPHHQRELVPFNNSVPIEIPTPVITTIQKPVPITVPVPKTIAVPQLQLVKIPIERIKPMPIERPVPYIVEKRVPYQVEKQVAKPVYVPYPFRVPVVNTVVHKIPGHGHKLSASKNSLWAHVIAKYGQFG